MSIRIGVDVGGTFTKAVAIDLAAGGIVAQAVIPTTHTSDEGVAAGVVECVARVAAQVGAATVELVTHSTTQAVNALLEGDVGKVGVVGMGRRPELKKAQQRTQLDGVELSPGKFLSTVPVFLDVSDGLDEPAVRAQLRRFVDAGVSAVATAEAFAPDDASNETRVAQLAAEAGLPSCASTDLSGLYGLELRAVTAALNASILPIALRTAGFVEDGVRAAGIAAPVMVMRGDGGATDLDGFRAAPARTLYSGPAASVAGALRHGGVTEGVVVEIGGTSTNVAAVKFGRPTLSYVQVASHATALRAVDVRVVGVAGGSMLRVRVRRPGKGAVYGVGPRSAHIAGLPYACFTDAASLVGARAVLISPKPGDPDDHLVLETVDGDHVAITTTCAANALGIPHDGDYCLAGDDGEAARAALELAGVHLGLDGSEVARRMLFAAGETVCELVHAVIQSNHLSRPTIVGVGGGAGGLAREVGRMMGLEVRVPDGAEVISSIGDALSLLRAERERTVSDFDQAIVQSMMDEVEAEVVAAGAAPGSVDVVVEEQADKGTVRAVATGAVGLEAGAVPGRDVATAEQVAAAAASYGTNDVRPTGGWWLATNAKQVVVFDRFGSPAAEITGAVSDTAGDLPRLVEKLTRYRGPVMVRPSVWLIDGARFIELSSGDVVASAVAMAAPGREQTFIVGRT